uniref:Remorin_C domain-containing protein n=1 Tax=Heterorhabditis bacteriophora TaxID=37862 RepID=A0A1I7XDW0_HETBA
MIRKEAEDNQALLCSNTNTDDLRRRKKMLEWKKNAYNKKHKLGIEEGDYMSMFHSPRILSIKTSATGNNGTRACFSHSYSSRSV